MRRGRSALLVAAAALTLGLVGVWRVLGHHDGGQGPPPGPVELRLDAGAPGAGVAGNRLRSVVTVHTSAPLFRVGARIHGLSPSKLSTGLHETALRVAGPGSFEIEVWTEPTLTQAGRLTARVEVNGCRVNKRSCGDRYRARSGVDVAWDVAAPTANVVPPRLARVAENRVVASDGVRVVGDGVEVLLDPGLGDGAADATITSIATDLRAGIVSAVPEIRLYELGVPGADLARVRALAGRLQGRPGVSMAGPQLALRAIGSATPDDYGPVDWNASSPDRRIWHHKLIGADRAWGFASRTEVDVGIVDSDIHLEHEDLAPNAAAPAPAPDTAGDAGGDHGTMTAGVACGAGNNGKGIAGTAWSCRLRAFQVPSDPDVGDIVDALRDTVRSRIRVANVSLAMPFFLDRFTPTCRRGPGPLGFTQAKEKIKRAVRTPPPGGAASDLPLFVVAAGNDSCNAKDDPLRTLGDEVDNVLVVGAANADGKLADFSNFGEDVPVAAGGGFLSDDEPGVYSTSAHGYRYAKGTSFSAPQVAGLAALVATADSTADAGRIKGCIVDAAHRSGRQVTTVRLSKRHKDEAFSERAGKGTPAPFIVDAAGAVRCGSTGGVLVGARRDGFVVIDDEGGRTRVVHPTGGPTGSPSKDDVEMVRRLGQVVFRVPGTDVRPTDVMAVDAAFATPPRRIGRGNKLVPAVAADRLWLVDLVTAPPGTSATPSVVREVDLSGNETTPTTPVPPGYTIAAAVDGGLVVRVTGPPGAAGSLLVWDPTANRTVREIAPSGQVVAAQGPMVAWTGPGAPGLHLTDLRTGEDRLVGAPPDFEFGPRGVFSPDGQRLAVSLGAGTGVAWTGARRHDVGIVDVASTSLFRFDNPATGALAFAWLPSSEWLYLVNGDAFRAYRPGDPGSKPVGTSPAGITGLLAFGPGQDTPPPAPPPPWPPAPAALPYPAPSPPPARPATPDDVHRLGGFVDSDVDGGGRLYSHAAQIDALVAWCSAHGGKLGNLNEATGSGGSGTGYCLPASPGDFANVDRPRILPGAVPIDTGPPR